MFKQLFKSLCFVALLGAATSSFAAPKSELLPQWQASDETNTQSIDHSQWQALLDKYLTSESKQGINRVDYKALVSNDQDALNDYVDSLLDIDPRDYSKQEQFAYWVNLYNAATVALIVENYPVESITKIKDGLLSFGPWDREWIEVGDEVLSLNDVEHRILRPIWQDNRIHYAVNCASLSCPNLSKQAFTAANTESLLESLASEYVNHPRGVSIIKGKLHVSSIYHWYDVDFEVGGETLISHLKQYAKPALKAQLDALKRTSYDHDYDWQLNDLTQKLTKF